MTTGICGERARTCRGGPPGGDLLAVNFFYTGLAATVPQGGIAAIFPMTVTFVEIPGFTAECLSVAFDEELRQFQKELAANPEDGDLIQHTGGLRKARF